MGSLPWKYNLLIEGGYGTIHVDLGNEKGWMEKYSHELSAADRLLLTPKDGSTPMPIVSVELDGDKRWVLFSKVHGRVGLVNAGEIRMYCIGWQMTVGDTNIKSLTWVYPNGVIECGPRPRYVKHYLDRVGIVPEEEMDIRPGS
jgi:hypothetical protein